MLCARHKTRLHQVPRPEKQAGSERKRTVNSSGYQPTASMACQMTPPNTLIAWRPVVCPFHVPRGIASNRPRVCSCPGIGVKFGLSGGRIESIMVSAPPLVSWKYNHVPEAGSEEERLVEVLKNPRHWASS